MERLPKWPGDSIPVGSVRVRRGASHQAVVRIVPYQTFELPGTIRVPSSHWLDASSTKGDTSRYLGGSDSNSYWASRDHPRLRLQRSRPHAGSWRPSQALCTAQTGIQADEVPDDRNVHGGAPRRVLGGSGLPVVRRGLKLGGGTRRLVSVGGDSGVVSTFMTWNLMHMARMIKDAGGIPAHGNQRSEWVAGCRPDHPNPLYR